MWDRLLFAARRLSVDLGGRLGSWRLSIVLMVVAGLYYGFLAIWATSSPPHVVGNIAGLIPFWLVYLLMLVNTGVCLWQRFPKLRRDLSERPRRWSSLGTYLFHGAFFVLAVGFLLSLTARQEGTAWVAVGERFDSRPDQFLSKSPPRVLAAGLPPVAFSVDRITPEFWEDRLLFTELRAELELDDGSVATTRINRPLWVGAGTFLRLSGFGFAPRWEVVDRHGVTLDSAFVKLNVFPPGRRDYFTVPALPHRFYVEVLPDLAMEDGTPVTRSLNLANPGVVVRVFRGRLDLGGDVLAGGAGYPFEGLAVRFPEIAYWGEFTIVRDPGAPVLFAGYAIGLAGLLLKLRRKG